MGPQTQLLSGGSRRTRRLFGQHRDRGIAARRPAWIYLTFGVLLLVFVPCLINALAWVAGRSPDSSSSERHRRVDRALRVGPPQRRRTGWTRVLAIDNCP